MLEDYFVNVIHLSDFFKILKKTYFFLQVFLFFYKNSKKAFLLIFTTKNFFLA